MTGRNQGGAARPTRRQLVAALGCAAAAVLVGARIGYVNATAFRYPVVHHALGERVDLGGLFLDQLAYEGNDGLTVSVLDAELLSYNEYIERYAADPTQTVEGLDAKSIVVLTQEFVNDGNPTGGSFFLMESKLLPVNGGTYYISDRGLLAVTGANCDESTQYIHIQPDSTRILYIPYTLNNFDRDLTRYRMPMPDRRFELVVSTGPQRHVFDIEVEA